MSLAETKKNCLAASNLPDEFPSSSNAIAGNNLSTYCNNTSMHIANGASAHYSNNVTHNHMETEDTNPCHLKASEVNNVLVSKIVNGSNNVYGAKNIHRSGSVENFMAQNQSSRRQDDSWLNGLHQNEDISNYDYFLANSRLITLSEDDPVFCQIEGDFIENNLLVTRICELKNSALLERFELEAGLMINQNPGITLVFKRWSQHVHTYSFYLHHLSNVMHLDLNLLGACKRFDQGITIHTCTYRLHICL